MQSAGGVQTMVCLEGFVGMRNRLKSMTSRRSLTCPSLPFLFYRMIAKSIAVALLYIGHAPEWGNRVIISGDPIIDDLPSRRTVHIVRSPASPSKPIRVSLGEGKTRSITYQRFAWR
ncbi:unnamed protein product [Linum trigynum]|uniref:Uncharacterized protein n=1 Tax=Linum trigynum TaxID=586398 RepID=A0AAV2F4C0_9ROSI